MPEVELNGSVTLASLQDAAPWAVARLAPGVFQNIDDLYRHLNHRGSLILRDATLTLPLDADRSFLGVHRLSLINSSIYVNGSDFMIVCNEYQNDRSAIYSFADEHAVAAEGADGSTPGASGADGNDGLHAGTLRVFITDEITSNGLISIDLRGQRGGAGGNGVPGAKGAKGGNGRNCSDGPGHCKAGCGDGKRGRPGQKGGDGGDGGDGGNGGQAEYWLHGDEPIRDRFFAFMAPGAAGGSPGAGAQGGEGGEGGNAGRSGCSFCSGSCRRGPKGPAGTSGSGGSRGTEGQSSYLKRSTFDVDYLKWVLDTTARMDALPVRLSMRTGLSQRLS